MRDSIAHFLDGDASNASPTSSLSLPLWALQPVVSSCFGRPRSQPVGALVLTTSSTQTFRVLSIGVRECRSNPTPQARRSRAAEYQQGVERCPLSVSSTLTVLKPVLIASGLALICLALNTTQPILRARYRSTSATMLRHHAFIVRCTPFFSSDHIPIFLHVPMQLDSSAFIYLVRINVLHDFQACAENDGFFSIPCANAHPAYLEASKTHPIDFHDLLENISTYLQSSPRLGRSKGAKSPTLETQLNPRTRVITPSIANGVLIFWHALPDAGIARVLALLHGLHEVTNPKVLHEHVHSIIKVGDEYDGGGGYSGINALDDLSDALSWAHWLTDPDNVRVERSVDAQHLQTLVPHLRVVRRLCAASHKGDIKVELDGIDLNWEPRPDLGLDRWHYDVDRDGGLGGGHHTLKFTLANEERIGTAQVCNAEILEFGDEDE
ncbi:hypothetical protein B0H10DRAFT_1948392 [Mycena sp. CBHHK59/15]|nr:hypothetical protein B0H10DRAFT_1948392 [Mycena sp. CBHHK59/15]